MKAKERLFDKLLKHTVLVAQEANVKWLFNLDWLKYHIVNDMFEKHIMSNREEGVDQRDLMIQFGDFDDSPNLDLLHRFMLKSHQTYPGSRGFLHFLFLPKIEKWKNSVEKTRPNYDYSTDKEFGDLITAFYMRRITLEEFGTKYKELTNFDISHLYPEFSPILNSVIEKE